MNLFDAHCHLEDERFEDDWRDALARMREAGVNRCILAGSDMETSGKIAAMTGKSPMIYGVVGVHPHEAKTFAEGDLARMAEWLRLPQIVGIGEIGLDYFYDLSPRDMQKDVLAKQLDFALERDVPVVFHVRDAHGDMTALLSARAGRLPRGVFHCFSGSVETAREYLDMGFYISFAGPVTYKNAAKLQEVARYVPADRLLVETDSPYLSPVPMRGKRNEPAYVAYVARVVAQLRGLDAEELAALAAANTCRLFGIAENE